MVDYYSTIKRNELLIHTATWVKLKNHYSEWKEADHPPPTAQKKKVHTIGCHSYKIQKNAN